MANNRASSKYFSSIVRVGVVTGLLLFILAPTASFAAKGSGSGKHGGGTTGTSYTGTFTLVLGNSTDGVPHWGQWVTFKVASNAPYPTVRLDCSQNGVLEYSGDRGYYPSYPFANTFTLSSLGWTSGAADCTATLYNWDISQKMGTLSFHVYA